MNVDHLAVIALEMSEQNEQTDEVNLVAPFEASLVIYQVTVGCLPIAIVSDAGKVVLFTFGPHDFQVGATRSK